MKELSFFFLLNNYFFRIVLSTMLDSSGEGKYSFSQLSKAFLDQGEALTYLGQTRLCSSSVRLIKGDVLIYFLLHPKEWLRIISKMSVFLLNLKLLNVFPCPHLAFCRRKHCTLPVRTKILLQCNSRKNSQGLLRISAAAAFDTHRKSLMNNAQL